VFLYAFDLIELDGDDLRREPLEVHKATLASVLSPGLRVNEHIEADGPTVFGHACKMGLEGIVSKRKTSTYRSGRSPDWLKFKNPACAAVKREAEEDWGRDCAEDVPILIRPRVVPAFAGPNRRSGRKLEVSRVQVLRNPPGG
jgi:ATP dependent DNA ligase domain